jgi:hypothetical protein
MKPNDLPEAQEIKCVAGATRGIVILGRWLDK